MNELNQLDLDILSFFPKSYYENNPDDLYDYLKLLKEIILDLAERIKTEEQL